MRIKLKLQSDNVPDRMKQCTVVSACTSQHRQLTGKKKKNIYIYIYIYISVRKPFRVIHEGKLFVNEIKKKERENPEMKLSLFLR